jgi:hypothetical protein
MYGCSYPFRMSKMYPVTMFKINQSLSEIEYKEKENGSFENI